MAEQVRHIYRVTGIKDAGLEMQLNFLLSHLSDRLDRMEGLRGNPRFYSTTFELPSGGATVGQVLRVTAADQAEMSDPDGSEVAFTPSGNITATTVQAAIVELDAEKQPVDQQLTDLAAGLLSGWTLVSIYDENAVIVHQFPLEWLGNMNETFFFIAENGTLPDYP